VSVIGSCAFVFAIRFRCGFFIERSVFGVCVSFRLRFVLFFLGLVGGFVLRLVEGFVRVDD